MNKEVYKYLLQTFGRKPGYWVGIGVGVLRPFLLVTVTGLIVARIVAGLASGDRAAAVSAVWWLFAVNIAGVLVGFVGELIAIRAENRTYTKIGQRFHNRLTAKDMSFYRDHQTGYLVSLFRQHMDSAMHMVRFVRSDVLRPIVLLVAPVIVLWSLDWRVGLAMMGVVLVQIMYITWSSNKAHIYRLRSHEIYRQVTGEVADQITNIVAFKASGKEKQGHARVSRMLEDETDTFWQRRKTTTVLDMPRGIITSIGILLIFLIILGNPSAMELAILTFLYMQGIIRSVNDLPAIITQHDDLVTKLQPTLVYLTDAHEAIRNPAKPHKLRVTDGAVELKNVSFGYPSHDESKQRIQVFDSLNLSIKGGEHVGVVGLSGAGKSTLASLLMRFDDVKSGSILIDGTNIQSVRQSKLRQAIAYVPQEPLLFHRTIRENIAYFQDDVTDAQIESAAKAAHAHEFIQRLPKGYDTIVGERGVKLSGGQKQRVAIARAILTEAPIMLFDEATSALDSESEKIIQQALPEILGRHTAIVIAHRLSTISAMDRIIVMHDGRITEEGTPRPATEI